MFGPGECTIHSTHHLISDTDLHSSSISIGRPLPGYAFRVLDEYLQPVVPDQVGEMFITGQSVFHGYLHRPDLTKAALITLDDDIVYYRTGDLGRVDPSDGVLYYVGRKDFQVKLRGQRIELGEIETVLMEIATNCVVIKTTHFDIDHLVVYVQTTYSQQDLRQHCLSRLPLYMVPSLFVILDHLPLNQNGKIDRKALPSPDFSLLSTLPNTDEQPPTEIENRVQTIWSQVLSHLDSIPSISTSFFSLGGNSLSLMRLSHLYQTEFQHNINISELFRHATIVDHARLLEKYATKDDNSANSWKSLNIIQGKVPPFSLLLLNSSL
jgi:acyl carrier protein